jgi:hypothetical protein
MEMEYLIMQETRCDSITHVSLLQALKDEAAKTAKSESEIIREALKAKLKK